MKTPLIALLTAIIAATTLAPGAARAASVGEQFLVNTYLHQQASRRMEQLLPNGEYTVSVSATLGEPEGDERIELPFASAPISLSELERKPTQTAIEPLLARVRKMRVDVAVTREVPKSVRDLIQAELTQQFSLQDARGDQIRIQELPGEFRLPWSAPKPQPASTTVVNEADTVFPSLKPIAAVTGAVAAAIVLLGFVLARIFRRHSEQISESLQQAAGKLESAAPMPAAPAMTAEHAPKAQAAAASAASSWAQRSPAEFWQPYEAQTVAAFCVDAVEAPASRSLVPSLLADDLPNDLAEKVRALLPKEIAELSSDEMDEAGPGAVRAMFRKHHADLKNAVRNDLGRALLRIGVKQVQQFLAKKKEEDILTVLTRLTPVRKAEVLRRLPTATKVKLAKMTGAPRSPLDLSTAEAVLVAELSAIPGHFDLETAGAINRISRELLEPASFEEDEALFQEAKKTANLPYLSVLDALDRLESDEWNRFNLQEVGFAFCGYSDDVVNRVMSMYEGKRLEWVRNFIDKARQQEYGYDHEVVVRARALIKQQLQRGMGKGQSA